jgi:hypothetical protein
MSVVPGLDGVTDIAVAADMVVRRGMLRGRLMPLLL